MPSRCRPAVARSGLATQAAGAAQQEQSQKLQKDYRCQEANQCEQAGATADRVHEGASEWLPGRPKEKPKFVYSFQWLP